MLKQLFQQNTAEKALVHFFEKVKCSLSQEIVSDRREQALGWFLDSGLPTRKVEAWHYTDLRTRLTKIPETLGGDLVITAGDGTYVSRGLAGQNFSTATDILSSINTAFAHDGASITFTADTKEPTTIRRTLCDVNGAGVHSHLLNRVDVEANAKAVLIVQDRSNDGRHLASALTQVKLSQNADFTIIIDSAHGCESTVLSRYSFILERDSTLTCFVLNSGSHTQRVELDAQFLGEGAHGNFSGVSLTRGQEARDIRLTVDHLVKNTTSVEKFRSVVDGEGHDVFQGLIRVASDAQKTDARLMINGLLLSDKAQFFTKPELEIFADDVQCGHGATSGQLHEEALFYLMTRGIGRKQAVAMLVHAFLAELVEALGDENWTKPLLARIEKWIAL